MTKMRLWKLGSIILLMLLLLFSAGCPRRDEAAPNGEAPAEIEPVRGGTLRLIVAATPAVLGHPVDSAFVFPALETLLAVSSARELEGVLAESWEEDLDNMRIIFHLREGVRFHDGSEFTAEVAKWNFEISIERERLRFRDFINSIETPDRHTLVININQWHNMVLEEWGLRNMFSKQAWDTHSHDEEWFTTNIVGTGPFKLESFTPDAEINWVRFEDYWQEGYPYLDRIQVLVVPEASTAAAMMEAGEAHAWTAADTVSMNRLEELDFTRQAGWAGLQQHIIPNSVNPESPFADKRVREALEYSLDKDAIVSALGYGYYESMYTIAPKGDWGGDRLFRGYNPERARALLAEAGYAGGGPEVTFLAQAGEGGRNTLAEAIAYYMQAVGFTVNIDIADTGRYWSIAWGAGVWEQDMILAIGGQDTNFHISVQRWWGHDGVYDGGIYRSQDLLDMSVAALQARTREEKKAMTEDIVYYIAREALVIPVSDQPQAFIHNGKLHTSLTEQGFTRWIHHDMWLEP